MPFTHDEVTEIVQAAISDYMQGFEQRLASSMQKALDTVTSSQDARLRALEEDLSKLLRRAGLDNG